MIEGLHDTYTMLVSFYLASRFFMGSYYMMLAGTVPMVRGVMFSQALLTIIPGVIWIASIHVEYPQRLGLIWTAIFIDLTAGMALVIIIRGGKFVSKRLGEWSDRVFEFYPAVNIEHKTERTNAFVALVFGYSVVAIIYQNAAHFGMNAFFGKATLGWVQAFCFNWIYFELDGADLFQHAIRRNVASGKSGSHVDSRRSNSFRSYAMGIRSSTFHHEFHSRSWVTLETRRCYRLPRCRARRLYRILSGEI